MMPPFSRRSVVITALAVAAVAVAAYLLAVPRTKTVVVLTTATAPAERVLAVNGRIRPRLQADIRSPLGGTLVELPFDVGSRVVQGQTLARIDDAPELAAIAEAEAAVAAQEATLAQARRELVRYEALGEFAAKRDVELRRLAVEEGRRELSRRRAAVEQAGQLRQRRILQAPFDGVILERLVDPGQTISPETIIYRLADLSSPQVTAEVDEIYAAEFRPDMEALINFPGQKDALNAKVLHIEPRVDPATGARDIRLTLPDGAPDAPAGLTVTINFIIERRQQAISIPRRAIVDATGKSRVRVVAADGRVQERDITFIDWPAEKVIVTSGLAAGERLLTDPTTAMPGEKVQAAD
jgi:RND family efflux transporter MFP subunit